MDSIDFTCGGPLGPVLSLVLFSLRIFRDAFKAFIKENLAQVILRR